MRSEATEPMFCEETVLPRLGVRADEQNFGEWQIDERDLASQREAS